MNEKDVTGVNEYICKLKDDLSDIQIANIFTARSVYLLFYYLITNQRDQNFADAKKNMIVATINNTECLDSLSSQVLFLALKDIYARPSEFAKAVAQCHASVDVISFSYSTFPALYGFFTSQFFAENAAEFVIGLIISDAPDVLVKHVFTSFLFSSYSLTEDFWEFFADLVQLVPELVENDVLQCLCVTARSIRRCITAPVFRATKVLCDKRRHIFDAAVVLLLNTTYAVWCGNSLYSTTLRRQEKIAEFICAIALKPDCIRMLSDCLLTESYRASDIPSFVGYSGFDSEWLALSQLDITNIAVVYKPLSEKIKVFEAFETALKRKTVSPFVPYAFNLFAKSNLHLEPYPVIFEGMEKLEFMMTLGYQYKNAIQFQNILESVHSILTGNFLNDEITKNYVSISAGRVNNVLQFYTNYNDPGFYKLLVFNTVFDIVSPIKLSPQMRLMFREVLKNQKNIIWVKDGIARNLIMQKYFTKFFCPVPRRSLGVMFKRISAFLRSYKAINETIPLPSMIDVFRIFITSMDPDDILDTFIFFERFAFRMPMFLKNLPQSLSTEWSDLFQVLWETSATNKDLLDMLLAFDAEKAELKSK